MDDLVLDSVFHGVKFSYFTCGGRGLIYGIFFKVRQLRVQHLLPAKKRAFLEASCQIFETRIFPTKQGRAYRHVKLGPIK